MDRRTFIKTAAGATGLMCTLPVIPAVAKTIPEPWERAFDIVSGYGFSDGEIANSFGYFPLQFRDMEHFRSMLSKMHPVMIDLQARTRMIESVNTSLGYLAGPTIQEHIVWMSEPRDFFQDNSLREVMGLGRYMDLFFAESCLQDCAGLSVNVA